MDTLNLSQRAMLADLSVSCWEAIKTDRQASKSFCTEHKTKQGAAHVRKRLLPQDCPEYKAVRNAATRLGDTFRELTSPWGEGTRGIRILSAANYMPLGDALRKARADYEEKVDAFISVYSKLREQARIELNGLFKEEDYPTEARMREKFRVHFSVMPLPASSDFRLHLAEGEVDILRAQFEQDSKAAVEAVTRDAFNRLREPLEKMVSGLQSPDEEGNFRYHDTLFTNLHEVAELLPRLNISDDPAMNKLASETREKITEAFSPKQCKVNPRARETALNEATRILSLLPPRRG